jgi:nucleoside-diphosphate-sugar epimerase
MGGVDVLVHTPAWHGIHLRERSERDFWELNVDGMFNVLQAAVAAGVAKVVWLSSTAAREAEPTPYVFAKQVGERLCAYDHGRHGIRCIVLRPPAFGPRPRRQIGEGLLRRRTDRRDVIEAVALAVEDEAIAFGTFELWPDDPFSATDRDAWA